MHKTTFKKPRFKERSHIPKKTVDKSDIINLFTIVQDKTNYNKLLNFVSERNDTFKLRNEDGDTVIHMILKNDSEDITERHQLELIKFFVEQGVSASAYNKNNETALHLAAKYQKPEIVKYLLSIHVDPNALTNQNMNAVHLAVQGTIEACKKDIKVKAIVPKSAVKEIPAPNLSNVALNVLEILSSKSFSQYIGHFDNTLENIFEMYPEETKRIKQNFIEAFSNMLKDIKDEADKRKLEILIQNNSKELGDMVENILKKTLEDMNIVGGQTAGWGPSETGDKILPEETPKYVFDNIKNSYIVETERFFNETVNEMIFDTIDSKINDIFNSVKDNLFINIYKVVRHNQNIKVNITQVIADGDDYHIDPAILKQIFKHKNEVDPTVSELDITQDFSIMINNIREIQNYMFAEDFAPAQKSYRATKSEIKEYIRSRKTVEEFEMTDDGGRVIVGENKREAERVARARVGPLLDDYDPDLYFIPINKRGTGIHIKKYLFISRLAFYVYMIKFDYAKIKINMRALANHLANKKPYYVYNLITTIILLIFNIFENMVNSLQDRSYIIMVCDRLKEAINNKYLDPKIKKHPYSYSYEYMIDSLDTIKKEINAIYKEMENIYKELTELHDSLLNKVVELLNKKSAISLIKGYHNNQFTETDTGLLENIFHSSLHSLKSLPPNFETYRKEVGGKDKNQKIKYIFEKYMPVVNLQNYSTFMAHIGSNVFTNPADGYYIPSHFIGAQSIEDLENHRFIYQNTFNNEIPSKCGFLISDVTNFLQPANIDVPKDGIVDEYLIRSDASKIGKLGIKKAYGQQRIRSIFPVVGNLLDSHFYMIKYWLIQNILKLYYNVDSNEVPSIADISTRDLGIAADTKDAINEIKIKIVEDLQRTLGIAATADIDFNSTIYIIVGSIADEIISTLIRRSIYKSSTKAITSIVRQIYQDKTLYELAPHLQQYTKAAVERYPDLSLNIPITGIDRGFSLSLNKLFDEIVEKFFNYVPSDNNELFQSLKYSSNLVKDIKQEKQFRIYNPDYIQTNLITENECYRIKPEIIDYLAEARANINQQDAVRSPPLIYAINTLNDEVVRKLLENRAEVYRNTIMNSAGYTPLGHAINMFSKHNKIVSGHSSEYPLQYFYNPFYEQIKKNILADKSFGNNIIVYMENIFPQLLFMYNHFLSSKMSTYYNLWSFDKSEKLGKLMEDYNLLESNSIFSKSIPLLDVHPNIVVKNTNLSVLGDKQKQLTTVGDKKLKEIQEWTNKKHSLEKEKDMLEEKERSPTGLTDVERNVLNNLIQKIRDIEGNITNIQNDMETNKLQRRGIVGNKLRRYFKETITGGLYDRVKAFSGSSRHLDFNSIAGLYKDIFVYVVNSKIDMKGHSDFKLYNELWSQYIKESKKHSNNTNIYPIVIELQDKLVDKFVDNKDNTTVIKNLREEFDTINSLYNDILIPIINDYELLDQKYGREHNYVLTEVIDIISHVVGLTICSNMYLAILKSITKYLLAINPSQYKDITLPSGREISATYRDKSEYNEFIRTLVDAIVDFSNSTLIPADKVPSDATLEKYVVFNMPKIFIKYTLGIFENDDPHEKIGSVERLFEPIVNIIISNTIVPIDKSSSLITNLNEHIFPYYKTLMSEFIPKMKVLIDNYNRYIINQGRYIKIVDLLFEKAVEEL